MNAAGREKRPIVFVSHASEDKPRFVRGLVDALDARGLETMLDERDFHLGDSLVQSVFDNGISASDVVVLVISENTAGRPWVREELDAAVTRMLEGRLRVIPVLLDGVEAPPPLRHRIYLRVTPELTIEDVARRIANDIFGRREATLKERPTYAIEPRVPGLTSIDVFLFGFIVEKRLNQSPAYPWVNTADILAYAKENDVSQDAAVASLYALGAYLEEQSECGTSLPIAFAPTSFGVEMYLRHTDPEYRNYVKEVVSAIVNDGDGMAEQVSDRTHIRPSLVEVILDNLASRGFLKVDKYSEGVYIQPAPTLPRALDE